MLRREWFKRLGGLLVSPLAAKAVGAGGSSYATGGVIKYGMPLKPPYTESVWLTGCTRYFKPPVYDDIYVSPEVLEEMRNWNADLHIPMRSVSNDIRPLPNIQRDATDGMSDVQVINTETCFVSANRDGYDAEDNWIIS